MKIKYIYFIEEGLDGKIKIGYSTNPSERLKTLQTSNPRTLRLLITIEGNEQDEKILHTKFSKYRLQGEWFEPNEEILIFIEESPVKSISRDSPHVELSLFFHRGPKIPR